MTIGERIRIRRKELEMTQQQLANKMGKTKSAICKVETDKEQNLTLDRVSEFSKALNCSESYLMGWTSSEYVNTDMFESLGTALVDVINQNDDITPKIIEYAKKIASLDKTKIELIFNMIDQLSN